MSRLGNSKGTRLGVVQNWYTVGLIKNKRNFLVKKDERFIDYVEQILMQEKMHKVGMIYSHSEVINKGAEVIINIFVYDGPFEEFLDGMVVKKASIIRRLQRKKVRIRGLRLIKRKGIKKNLLKKSSVKKGFKYILFSKCNLIHYILKTEGERYYGKNVKVNFKLLANGNVTADLIARFICIKLKQKYSMGETIGIVKRGLKRLVSTLGYRVDFSGRFTRAQRSRFLTVNTGKMPLSSIEMNIDYGYRTAVLKYGICGVKVWMYKKKTYQKYAYSLEKK